MFDGDFSFSIQFCLLVNCNKYQSTLYSCMCELKLHLNYLINAIYLVSSSSDEF